MHRNSFACLWLIGFLVLGVSFAFASEKAAPAKIVYLSPNGSDSWSGRFSKPNVEGTDGPLATLEAARDRIRQWKSQGALPQGGVEVVLQEGTYPLRQTFTLDQRDSGTPNETITYRAAEGANVTLSGGTRLTDFTKPVDPTILERLDPAARDQVVQCDLKKLGLHEFEPAGSGKVFLIFNHRPMQLARWPNEGFTKIAAVIKNQPVDIRGTKGDAVGQFVFEGTRPKRWVNENDAWLQGYWFWDWSEERHSVESIDLDKKVISLKKPYHRYGYRKDQWYYALNLLCEIDQPGEWYLDREKGTLYFWPPEPIESAETVLSRLPTLVQMENTSYVTFRSLGFEAARESAILVHQGSYVTIADSTLRNLGRTAIKVDGGNSHTVDHCELTNLGYGGISLRGGDRKTLTPAGHQVTNNRISRYGLWKRTYESGISIYGVGQRVAHNLIFDAPHFAIYFDGNDHTIEYNEVHHVCLESNDSGAIYAGRDWSMHGTRVRFNYVHDVMGHQNRGASGVYLDDMFGGTEIYGNVFYHVSRALLLGGGRHITVENNLFVDCDPAIHVDARGLKWAADTVPTTMTQRLLAMPYQKPPWTTRYPELVNTIDDQPAAPKGTRIERNVFCQSHPIESYKPAEQYVIIEKNLEIADPGFVDRAKDDFRLRSDSPVYQKLPDFQPIPFEKIGIQE